MVTSLRGLARSSRRAAASLARMLGSALSFWSRLPVPGAHGRLDLRALALAAPLAGVAIGAVGAAVLLVARAVHLPAGPAAVLAVAALVLATGAMHEDALSDVADGFGGGRTPEHRLQIMRDPRLGTYGVAALALALALKITLLTGLVEVLGVGRAGTALVAAAGASRMAGLWPLVVLPPARQDGIGHAAGPLPLATWLAGAALGAGTGGLAAYVAVGVGAALAALAGVGLVSWALTGLGRRLIGGQTGDLCGAIVALADLAMLLVLLAAAG